MKNLALAAAVSLAVLSSLPARADSDPLPNSGTYFITSMSSDEALQPAGASAGQNVLLYEYNRSGMQKWAIDRKRDPKTGKPTNRYTIKLAGENGELNFEPHPVADCSAILGADKSVMVLESGDAGMLIKSVAKNGDALYVYPQPPLNAEARFGPNDGSSKFRWKFTLAD
ncbi:MAG TPA: hypothetical protein EYN91_12670 [Candidatus Melainabacteria bacterium]|jgi:hypothetical protein|nr:hypothetical protein [Candidatus Melainabacteria bacterium]HIN67015.1 hypothetical protein [Candidatus Obscuribacterales bacterium]